MADTRLADIMDTGLLAQMMQEGYIRSQVHPDDPDLRILNYTEKAQFDRVWNDATRQCRGLIVRDLMTVGMHTTVVARPFPKFFNYGENGVDDYDFYALAEVTDKKDGSLGILYNGPDGPAIATRGSFASDQALHATEVYRERYEGTWMPRDGETYLFEIVFPANRIVLDYGQMDDLVLIGSVRVFTGGMESPKELAKATGWPGPVTEVFPQVTLFDALKRGPREGAEGLVVRFIQSREMVKLKQEDYVLLHRIIFGLNERAVWQRLFDGEEAEDINEGLPEEFHPWVDKVAKRIKTEAMDIVDSACDDFAAILKIVDAPAYDLMDGRARKKRFASRAIHSDNRGLLFLLYDDKSLHEAVYKMIRPEAVSYSKEAA